ncbi:MAG: hypothetical protein IPH74_09115 [Bacteroidetes bacterium]|nr:hypothetical protein [Bacteroidota bacterium]
MQYKKLIFNFMVDATTGITDFDGGIWQMDSRRTVKTLFCKVVNKVDNLKECKDAK